MNKHNIKLLEALLNISNESLLKIKTNKFKKIMNQEINYQKNKDKNIIYLDFRDIYYKYEDQEKLDNIWETDDHFLKDIYNFELYKLCKISGRYKESYEYHEPNYWVRDPLGKCILSITYQLPACKEFVSLNNYIQNILKCKPLNDNDIYIQSINGKRSSIFERGKLYLLAFEPEKCKQIKQLLLLTKKPNWKAEIKLKSNTNYGDRYNIDGEDMESEWYGYEYQYAEVIFKTPSGKIMKTVKISLFR